MSTTEQTAPAGTWTLDPVHSTASFAVKHMGVSNYRTSFKTIDAVLDFDGERPKLVGKVPVESIDVADEMLRGHLLSPDFFDAANHPYITFESAAARVDENGVLEVEGDLTVKGITRRVTAKGSLTGPVTDVAGKLRVGVELEAVVDRTQLGLTWNAQLPNGGVALDNDVTIAVHLELTHAA
jgi:polyisoprenoid-binding protein YceI